MDYVFRMDGDVAHSTPLAAGPWSPNAQHGGAPASLIVRAAETAPSLVPMRIARLTIDLMRPVPIAPLTVERTIVREGKKLQLLQIRLVADGLEVTRASVLRLRREALPLPQEAASPPIDLPSPEESRPPVERYGCPFNTGLTMRPARGAFGEPGPASIWQRIDRPIFDGEAILPVMRAAVCGDFCNGTSSHLRFDNWTFINADLTISLARDPIGDWILLDAETFAGPEGGGHAFARLGDRHGWFGRAGQSVIFEKR